MRKRSSDRTAGETARLIVQLCAIAELLQSCGYCTGELVPRDVLVRAGRLERARCSPARAGWHRIKRHLHGTRGHDLGCHTIAVPLSTIRRLTLHWAGEHAADYLIEAVELAIAQVAAGEWPGYSAAKVVKYEIGRRLTIESPADSTVP